MIQGARGSCRTAFFLIEQLIVCALFALLFTFAFYSTTFFNGLLVRFELHHLAMTCRTLQWQAVTSNNPQMLTFDSVKNSYKSINGVHKLPQQVQFGADSAIKGPPSSPTHPIAKSITFVDNIISFAPTGIVSSGTVYLKDISRTRFYALTNAVSSVSLLRFYRYEQNKWKLL